MILRILVISGEHKKGERDGFLVPAPGVLCFDATQVE